MSRSPGPAISGPLLRLFGEGSLIGLTEHELLDRFRTAGDEQAFEALVDRHGPMVLSVCRRVLGPGPDSEDAFQATFLVLARKAGQLRSRHLLGPWLHRVALRASWRAAAVARRRRRFEGPAGDALDQMVGPDDRPDPDHELLHREIDRLPASYRRVVLLCDLSGHSHSEAAALLGWPLGTVKGRHFRARELLRSRLARLGLAVSAVTLAQAGARASVPAGLAVRVAQAATRISCTGAAWLGVSAIPAERLMKGVLLAMFLEKIKLVAVVLVPATVLGMATMAGAASWQEEVENGQAAQSVPSTAESSKESRPGAVDGLIGCWELRSSKLIDGTDFLSRQPYRSWTFEPLKEDFAALLRYDGKALLLTAKGDKVEDSKAIVVARDGEEYGQYDLYTGRSLLDEGDAKPDMLGIFRIEGTVLTQAHANGKTRPNSFGPGENIDTIFDVLVRVGDFESVTDSVPKDPIVVAGAITNPLVGLWELESVDGRAMPDGIYLKMVPSPVLPTSEEDRESTWLVLKSISVGNDLPYAYADQFVAVGGGEEKRGFNCYTPGSLANAEGSSPATRGEYQLEGGGKLTITTVITAPRLGAVDAGGGPRREVRVYHRVEGGNPKVEEAEARAEALPGAGNPIAPDPIERKEAAVGEMVRTHNAIQEIRNQLKQLHETTAENTVDAEYTSFRVELIKEEIREGSAELRRLENRSPAELENLSQAEVIVMKNLKYRMAAENESLSRLLKQVAEAKSKVEQSRQEIERLNEELKAVYRDRKAAGDTLERP